MSWVRRNHSDARPALAACWGFGDGRERGGYREIGVVRGDVEIDARTLLDIDDVPGDLPHELERRAHRTPFAPAPVARRDVAPVGVLPDELGIAVERIVLERRGAHELCGELVEIDVKSWNVREEVFVAVRGDRVRAPIARAVVAALRDGLVAAGGVALHAPRSA
jgi:hypothetical protein